MSVSLLALGAWTVLLLLPSQPHRTRERLAPGDSAVALRDVTVLIPARNEAAMIEKTLDALGEQGPGLEIIVVDDGSDDGTARVCRDIAGRLRRPAGAAPRSRSPEDERRGRPAGPAGEVCQQGGTRLRVIEGKPLPTGWGGKLWALEQGLAEVARPYTLLLDADIVLAPGMIAALLARARDRGAVLVSIMARLRCAGFWARLLVPPFVFFFKLLYPFARVNDRRQAVAAAAGGCVLVETSVLREVGAFASFKDALIDDCALARRVKGRGYAIWLGLSHSVRSSRAYAKLDDFWEMVSRTAFTQLGYSTPLLLLTSGAMIIGFAVPIVAVLLGSGWAPVIGLLTLAAMVLAVVPVIRFYGLSWLWAFAMPLAAGLYLLMTWSSAVRYWRGTRATWKNRAYEVVD
jgi:hopene-associated glycosyltransferase HpnB